ncbi:hypothetical protein [Levilactobacillus namurensis]|uniref:hypothetical protein n=1 Tax=Levilactobacillus namurensis TaxID=380393 RepID=UPI00222EB6A5|nr:hypothetical protein [Levilactobacillus namurensis]MCW3778684.1 hypothetical protein [Levilactobacillus namurensis]MDT7019629.1 hypothetical protein [Levilactobacillus namurensis]WNN65788.1 hypothetical protein RIN67_01465 [Levilactobacillus namurensis]
MRDRNVISWAVVSLIGFLVINVLMHQSFIQGTEPVAHDLGRSTLIAVILYAIPIVLAALDWKPSFYVMGLVIVIYSLGLVGVILNMLFHSDASLLIRTLMSAFGVGMLVANGYWLVLALRLRLAEQKERDRRRFGK